MDANAKYQSGLLSKSWPVIPSLIKQNKLKVVDGGHDIAVGVLKLLE
jgi:hypothetical protein